ncbi:YkvA family protein [Methanosarcina sp.]|uniref:YkvA family protein n=1 Tax=Methanosarcina sp. TaxID=2213 RepID=UPI003C77D310
MEKIDNVRTKQIEANLEHFNISPNKVSDTSMGFPEEVRDYRSTDFRNIWDYLGLLFSMLLDSFKGKYPLPKKTLFVITFALLYLISPVDIAPDIFPVIGFADDIAVLAFAASLIKGDLENYRVWKNE